MCYHGRPSDGASLALAANGAVLPSDVHQWVLPVPVNVSNFSCLLPVSCSASTSPAGTPVRSGWWTCRRARTWRRCVWVRAGRPSPPARCCCGCSRWAASRGRSSACRGRWCAWPATGSSCWWFTTEVRPKHTPVRRFPESKQSHRLDFSAQQSYFSSFLRLFAWISSYWKVLSSVLLQILFLKCPDISHFKQGWHN